MKVKQNHLKMRAKEEKEECIIGIIHIYILYDNKKGPTSTIEIS